MTPPGKQVELTNWSKSANSACYMHEAGDVASLLQIMETAQAQGLSVIPHGAGHSYTDAALNTGGIVIDVTPMRRILLWDATQGIMRVEPGVSLQEITEAVWKDGWWPAISPSTARVTVGGCAAMNVNGRNAWKCGPFGSIITSMDVLFSTGETRTLMPKQEPQLFHAFIGSMGLLGIIISITIQLQRVGSGYVSVHRRSAAGLDGIFSLFAEEEQSSDFLEAWLDGFASGNQLGRGLVTSAVQAGHGQAGGPPFSTFASPCRLEETVVSLAAGLARPVLPPAVQMANRVNYWLGAGSRSRNGQLRGLIPYTYWPGAFFSGYHALLPQGVETFQAFVPQQAAPLIFKQVLL